MNSEISKRFVACHDKLKTRGLVKSSRQFALALDFAPQSFSDIVNGKRDVTIDLIRKAVGKYKFNSQYIFTGEGPLFSVDGRVADPILSVVVDGAGTERIVHVPVSAQAGYTDQLYDRQYLENLPSFTLPGEMFKMGTYRCFDVKGDSMEPTIISGERVVCSFVEKDYWVHSIKDNHVYVVVADGGVVVKRLINNISADRTIKIISDNSFYSSYDIDIQKIKEIWKVEVKISNFMDSPSHARNALHEEIEHLRTIIENQSKQIAIFNQTMELVLKKKRVG
jgi:hypothetical protein